ncbi:unnamed protein product [Commensalibacter communis]|nr:unnamed protein product [Commensalibacter communis]CAI3949021.1 unnamed protein product [Commensalibacter communis]
MWINMKNTFRWMPMLAIGKSEAIDKFPNTSNAVFCINFVVYY